MRVHIVNTQVTDQTPLVSLIQDGLHVVHEQTPRISQLQVAQAIEGRRALFDTCRRKKVKGKLTLSFSVLAKGRAVDVKASGPLADSATAKCVLRMFKHTPFPKFGKGKVEATHTFEF